MPDAARTRRLSAAQCDAVERLVREVGPRLFAYVRHCFPVLVDAEEIVSECICRAAERIETVLACDRPELYLFRVARTLSLDRLRAERRTRPLDPELDRAAGTSQRPERQAEESEALARLRQAVSELPAPQREVVVLRMSAGMPFEQIAELLHVPLGTALSRMHTALQHLRRVLGSES